MFAMFVLKDPDVMPTGDLGLRQAATRFLAPSIDASSSKNYLTPKQVERMSEIWKPYRSVATLMLYLSLDFDKKKEDKDKPKRKKAAASKYPKEDSTSTPPNDGLF